MEKYTHITQIENIMVQHNQTLKEMNRLLDTLDTQPFKSDFEALSHADGCVLKNSCLRILFCI